MKSFMQISFLVFFLFSLTEIQGQYVAVPTAPGKLTTVEKSYTDGVIDGYTVYVPKSYGKPQTTYPIILFLHGGLGVGGEVAVVNEQPLPQLLLIEPDPQSERDQYLRDSFIIISPHLTEGSFRDRQFYNQAPAIRQMLGEILKAYRADPNRVYVTGLSRGGHGTWGLASRMNDFFAAAVPICGALHGVDDPSTLKEMPIWTIHNTGDELVDYNGTVKAVAEIEKQSGKKFLRLSSTDIADEPYLENTRIFTSFQRDGHDAWTDVYENVEVYKWLLRQKR